MGIGNRYNKVDIARILGKALLLLPKKLENIENLILKCKSLSYICVHRKECEIYEGKTCKLIDRSLGACNKYPKITNCHLDKYFYYATKTNQEYLN